MKKQPVVIFTLLSLKIAIFIFVCIIRYTSDLSNSTFSPPSPPSAVMANVEVSKRRACTNELTFCFETAECRKKCLHHTSNAEYACINGVCRNLQIVKSTRDADKCSLEKGLVAFLVGDRTFGTYDFVCKSIDPGIAITEATNLMCKGGSIGINYVRKFPSVGDCRCAPASKCLIPATSEVREHVQCDERYYDLLQRSYGSGRD